MLGEGAIAPDAKVRITRGKQAQVPGTGCKREVLKDLERTEGSFSTAREF